MRLLTLARDLRRRRARERNALFVAEGVRTTEELLRAPIVLRGALIAPRLAQAPRGAALRESLLGCGVEVAEVTDADLASAAETESPQGVLVIAETPERRLGAVHLPGHARVLVLDAIQDPGNAGTLIRTAAALGASAVLALPGTVDLWNAKVVRSAMGALFHNPVLDVTWSDLGPFLDAGQVELWGADANGEPPGGVTIPPRLALAVGNEGAGLSTETRLRMSRAVSLPLEGGVESLNVAVAAGILLHELRT